MKIKFEGVASPEKIAGVLYEIAGCCGATSVSNITLYAQFHDERGRRVQPLDDRGQPIESFVVADEPVLTQYQPPVRKPSLKIVGGSGKKDAA
jgi:hypothetical protein